MRRPIASLSVLRSLLRTMRAAASHILASLAILLFPKALSAQTGSLRVSLPSPTVASLGKFGDVPVSLYSGVPDISIPLFRVMGRTLELPITLKYHAGGIRVEEIGGWVGIGWSLEAGGAITRTVRGLVDEGTNGYYATGTAFYSPGNWPNPPTTLLDNIRTELVDGEPDQFFFSFAGRSGQFVMGPTSTSPSVKEYRTVPQQKLDIVPTFAGSQITKFVVTTEDGTRFTFGAAETSTDYNTTSSGSIPAHYGESYTSSWHLTGIKAAGGDSITLAYTTYTARHRLGTYREKFDEVINGACVPSQFDVYNEYEIVTQRLTSITSAAHTVSFGAGATLRSDALSPLGVAQEPRLDSIYVTPAGGGALLRKFKFAHDYSTGRLTLRSVTELDRNNVQLPPYSFTYNGTALPSLTSYAQDFWGFYNGKSGNTTTIPPAISPNGVALPGADRNVDANYAKSGVLTRITYPTGGYNEFEYESNDYGAVTSSGDMPIGEGPLQTRVVNSWEGTGSGTFTIGGTEQTIATVRVYGDPTGCEGQIYPPCPYAEIVGKGQWFANTQFYLKLSPGTYTINANDMGTYPTGWISLEVKWRNKGPLEKKNGGGLRVSLIRTVDGHGNTGVRKYFYTLQSTPTRSSGAVSAEPDFAYSYSSPTCSYFSRASASRAPLGSGPPVGYREVMVWHGGNAEFGKTLHKFRTAVDVSDPLVGWPFGRRSDYEWMRGQETAAVEYNATGQVQRRTTSAYNFAPTATTKVFQGVSINAFSAGLVGTNYVWAPFQLISNWAFQTSDSTIIYNESGASSIATGRTVAYGNAVHGLPTQITETNSNGNQRITRMKYPADYATGSGNVEASALSAMQGTSHIHSPVIERWVAQKVGATETVLQAEVTTYKQYGAGQYRPYQTFVFNNPSGVTNFTPSSVSGEFTKDSRYLLQETANLYDSHGRITQLTDPRGKVTNYQYGVGNNGPFLTKVTRVKDATGTVDLVTDLAYDSDGYLSSIKDEGGTFRYFTYDLFGRLRQVKNHAGTAVKGYGYTYSRTAANNWTYQTGTPNSVVDTTYLQQTPTVVQVASTTWLDGLGREIQTVTKDGTNYHVTATQYDLMGRPWRAWNPYTRTTAGYDPSFSTTATSFYNTYLGVSNAKPYIETQYTTDALARVKTVIPEYVGTSPTITRQHAYGVDVTPKHSYTEVTDESGKKQRTYFDVFGSTVKSILGYGATEATTTNFTVNVLGQQTQATDPRSLNTSYSLNTRGLLTARTSPDAGTVSHKYDKGGNLRYTQDAVAAGVGKVSFTTYDFAGRPLTSGRGTETFSSLDPDLASPPALETTTGNWLVVRKYDAKPATGAGDFPWNLFSTQINGLTLSNVSGRPAAVASKSNGAWQVSLFSYDTDGRVATRYTYTQANGGGSVLTALNTTVSYTRDLRDALTQRTLTVGSSTWYQWYDYNGRGLLWKVFASTSSTKPGTADATYTYRPGGQLQDRQFAGGPLVPLKYTIREELQKIGDPAVTTYPFSARYAYHSNGTVNEAEFYSAGSPAANKRYRYVFGTSSYDALNRLKSADFSSWNGSSWTSTLAHDLANITYDLSGNLLSLQRYKETGSLVDNLTYANASTSNRLTSITDAVSPTAETWDAETGSFTYDANGNMLTAPAPYSLTASTYDHQNLPLAITRSGTTTTYRYNDAGQRITKQVGTGNTEVYLREGSASLGGFTVNGSGTPTSWHFNLLAGDKVIGRQPNTGNRKYYHPDLLGSTRSVVEGATVVESYDFEPWGLLMPGRTLGSGTKEGFTGKEMDAESGLDYFGARYYMPALGRFGSPDPQAPKFAEWSPYSYTLNNPLALVDPDGECPIPLRSCAGRQGADLAAGFTPGLSTAVDATTLVTGRNPVTGEKVGVGGRLIAAIGLFTPASGGQLRAARRGVQGVRQAAKHADEAVDATRVVQKAGGEAARGGFRSFSSLKRSLGPAGEGKQWHHVVEQSQVGKFGAEAIHNADNVVAIPTDIHQKISGFYSSKQPFTGGQTVREWLGSQSFEQQRAFGQQVLRDFGVGQ